MTLRSVGRGLRTVGGAPLHSRGSALAVEPFNLCPPFDQWELSGGAYLENGELVVPPGANGVVALSPPIAFPSGPRGSMRLTAEALLSGGNRRYWTTLYYLNGVTSTETALGDATPGSEGAWHTTSWPVNNLTNGSSHVRWRVERSAITAPTQRFRYPRVTSGSGSASWAPYGRVTPVAQNLLIHPVPVPGSVWARNNTNYDVYSVSSPTRPDGGSLVRQSTVNTPTSLVASLYAVGSPNTYTLRPKVVPGREYTASMWFMSPVAGNQANVRVSLFNGPSSVLSSNGPLVTLPPGVWTRVSHTVTAPAGSDNVSLSAQAQHADSSNAAVGEVAYVGDAMLTEGATLHDWFHGLTPPDALYTYAWSGDPEVSSSYRIPILGP